MRNGRFAVHGLDPDTEVPVYFLEPKRKLGAGVNLSGKSAAGGPVTVRLEPCGAAKARLVDPDGKPVARAIHATCMITMVVTPGPPLQLPEHKDKTGLLAADEDDLTQIDPINYESELVSDAAGTNHAPRPDPRRDVSLHRLHDGHPRPDRPRAPQGIHRQAGRDARPGRYPDREAFEIRPVRLEAIPDTHFSGGGVRQLPTPTRS